MANIKKAKTNEYKHVRSTGIKAMQVVKDKVMIGCILNNGAEGAGEAIYEVSPNMLRRVKTGNGALHKDMQSGLRALPHWECELLIKTDDNGKQIADGVHMIPTANYAAADMSQELQMPVADNAAIIQVYESGEIDVLAFPYDLYPQIMKFLHLIEDKTSLSTGDSFTNGNTTYTVQRIVGDMITFRCQRAVAAV